MTRCAILVLVVVGVTTMADVALGERVVRRGGAAVLVGEVISIGNAGVRIKRDSGAEQLVPWDRVRDVQTRTPHARMREYLETAEVLWRARSRLERRDAVIAEPLFERLWPEFRGQTHETALVVAEGLLRCRLARGRRAAAVVPALEVARLRRAGERTDSYSGLPEVLDETTALCPRLAPVWSGAREVATLDRDLREYDPQGDAVVADLAALYLAAARATQGRVADMPVPGTDAPGVALLAAAVACGAADASVRAVAREEILDLATPLGPWAEAWARYAAGVSLLSDVGTGRRQRGLLQLAYLPARYAQRQPFLARIALANMIEGFSDLGDTTAAATLTEVYTRQFGAPPASEGVGP